MKSSHKKLIIIAGIVLSIGSLAYMLFPKPPKFGNGFGPGGQPPPGGAPPPFVKTESVPIERGNIMVAIYGTGQLKPKSSFDLKLGVQSKITDIVVRLGEKVKRGQLLVIFEGMPSFRSPINGTVTSINYHIGESAFPQSTLLSVVDSSEYFLEMSLDQKSLRQVKPNQDVRLSFDGYREIKFSGKVDSIYSNNSQFYALIQLTKSHDSFLPGMTADVAIIVDNKSGVLLAPLGAIKNQSLLVMRENGPSEIPVTLGAEDDSSVEIVAGDIREGDTVLIRPTIGKNFGGPPR